MAAGQRDIHPKRREKHRDADGVQDMGVRGLRPQGTRALQSQGGDWSLSIRAVRVHNRHIQNVKAWYAEWEDTLKKDRPKIPTCRCLREGLEGFLTPPAFIGRYAEGVVESDGVDPAEGSTSPRDSGAGDGENPVLWE